ncbi:hypothetical protein BOTNAR_0390g00020 [Botryotinia narcissicola]|uniref:Uncharacterized protein n=1 Tax=Botryotinia narcissicola TaxID=278944 RepID=A0A4Z1HNR1_9HELO|nr:hypothetical protein BOTNAR_0390g00020 [Botryotinia narcissicola]
MEVSIDTALLFKQIKDKVTRDGDDQGEVTEELFECELKVLRKRLRLKKPEDTPLEHEIRTANSICAYFWHENGIKKAYELFPDAFTPRSRSKAPEAKIKKVERPLVAPSPPSSSTTMIAGIPLQDWLALKQGDPETAKELMESWKAAQAEKKAEEAKAKAKKEAEEAEAKAKREAEESKAKSKSDSTAKKEGSESDVDLSHLVDNRETSAYASGGAWRNRLQPNQDKKGSKSQDSNQKKGSNPQGKDERESKQVEFTLPLRSDMQPLMYVAVQSQPGQVSKMFVGPKGEELLQDQYCEGLEKEWEVFGTASHSTAMKEIQALDNVPAEDKQALNAAYQFWELWTQLKNRPETRTALEFLNILLKDPEQVPQDGPLKEFLLKTKRILNSPNHVSNFLKTSGGNSSWAGFSNSGPMPGGGLPSTDFKGVQSRLEPLRSVGDNLGSSEDEIQIARLTTDMEAILLANEVTEEEMLDPNGPMQNESKARVNWINWRNQREALVKKRKTISAVYRGGVNVNAVTFGDPNPFGLLAKKESKEGLKKGLKKEGLSSPAEAESEETSKTITEGGEDAGGDTSVD